MTTQLKNSRFTHYTTLPILKYDGELFNEVSDSIIQEMPLDIYVNGEHLQSITCSPWDIEELVMGLLAVKNVIRTKQDLVSLTYDKATGAVYTECCTLQQPHEIPLAQPHDHVLLACEAINNGINMLENGSKLFHRTGGVHSAVLMGDTGVLAWFEDIGRHSALDKLIGWSIMNNMSMTDKVILFSGRVPYEIIHRVVTSGCHCIISPGAPTGLSIQEAIDNDITLIGFAKHGHFNVYSHPERVIQQSRHPHSAKQYA